MKLVINLDEIEDPLKKEWLIQSLKLTHIDFKIVDETQTIAQYNRELESGNAEIEKGDFITAADLKTVASNW